MNEELELIIKKFKRILKRYPTCEECDIRHTCTEIANRDRLCICDILDMMEEELNIK